MKESKYVDMKMLMEQYEKKYAQALTAEIDHLMDHMSPKLINKPTKYSGKGRPRKTDYAEYIYPYCDKGCKNRVLNI